MRDDQAMKRVLTVAVAVLVGIGASTVPGSAAGFTRESGKRDERCPSIRARVVKDLAYVDDPVADLQRLDVYAPARTKATKKPCRLVPIVVWVHGGGWAKGDKRANATTKAGLFNDLGYVFVSVNYRLSAPIGDPGRPMHPAHADDIGAAIAWLEANADRYGGDGTRIALLGHSAGAHLVALVGTDPTFVERAGGKVSAIRCVGSYDTASYDLVQRSAETRLVENAFGPDDATLRDASPIQHLEDRHLGDRKQLPAFQVVVRGTPARRATQEAFAVSAEAASGAAIWRIDGVGLSHADVNKLIGAPGDTRMTPAVTVFVQGCLDQAP